MPEPVFKDYAPNLALRVAFQDPYGTLVDHVIDQMDMEGIISTYKGDGTSSYHPRMMLKVDVYGYVERITSCRIFAKAVGEQMPFMWLTGGDDQDEQKALNERQKDLSKARTRLGWIREKEVGKLSKY